MNAKKPTNCGHKTFIATVSNCVSFVYFKYSMSISKQFLVAVALRRGRENEPRKLNTST